MRLLGWGNVALGLGTPLSIGFNILAALDVFSFEWARGNIFIATLLGAVLGSLSWRSGWEILNSRASSLTTTCIAAGLTLGYTGMGILIMTTAGIDRGLQILIRHGSEDWWDWTLSHFQNSCLLEIPVFAWWLLGLCTVIRYRLPGWPEKTWDRLIRGLTLAFCFIVIGAMSRSFQMANDLLASQR